jgi:hypothetical protein
VRGFRGEAIEEAYEHIYSQKRILPVICEAISHSQKSREIAEKLKKSIENDAFLSDRPDAGPWHCVVGSSFATSISHQRGDIAVFKDPSKALTVWNTRAYAQ